MVRFLPAVAISAVLWTGLVMAAKSVATTCVHFYGSLGGLVSLAPLWP